MPRGGSRPGAGRKKGSEDPRPMRGFRLTDAEWGFMKEAIRKYRARGEDAATETAVAKVSSHAASIGYSNLESGLLAHFEALYKEDLHWLREYERYLTSDYYEKYTIEEIRLHRKMIQVQIIALMPHLLELGFDYEVKRACSPDASTDVNGIEIRAWHCPDSIDYFQMNRNLLKTFQERNEKARSVTRLERLED